MNTQVRKRPILFSAPMVRAIIDGRKTVTRRIVSAKVPKGYEFDGYTSDGVRCSRPNGSTGEKLLPCPYGGPGDRLWLQEAHTLTLGKYEGNSAPVDVRYHADGVVRRVQVSAASSDGLREQVTVQKSRGRPGRFLPHWASRLALEVVSVRVERLHEITEEDAKREGVAKFFDTFPSGLSREQTIASGERAIDAEHRAGFAVLWDTINGERDTWKSNPWVWRVEFWRVS